MRLVARVPKYGVDAKVSILVMEALGGDLRMARLVPDGRVSSAGWPISVGEDDAAHRPDKTRTLICRVVDATEQPFQAGGGS